MSNEQQVQKAAKRKLQDLLKSSTTSALASAVKPASASPKVVPRASEDGMAKLLAADGVFPGDPLYAPLMRLEGLLEKVAAGADTLNAQVRATGDAEVERVKTAVMEVETQSVARMTAVLDHSVRSLYRGMQWWTGALLGAALCVAALVGAAGGWWLGWRDGRASVEVTEERVSEAFQHGPDAAEIWRTLMENNDPRQALEECKGKAVWYVNGRKACRLPLWLDGLGVPDTTK